MIWLTSRNYYHDTFIEQPSSCILIYIKEKRKKNIFSLWLELLGFTLTTFIYKCSSFNYSYHVHYIANAYISYRASLLAQRIKRLPAMQETWVRSLGWEDPLEKEMATHSNILAWRIPWTEEPDGLQSMGSQRVGHDWASSHLTYIFYNWRFVSFDHISHHTKILQYYWLCSPHCSFHPYDSFIL